MTKTKCEEIGCNNDAVDKIFTKVITGPGLPRWWDLRLCDEHARQLVKDYTGPKNMDGCRKGK